MVGTCEHCGARMDLARSRRTPKYCGPACRQAAYRQRTAAAALPAELRSRDRWVLWNGRKVPLQVDGRPASSTDPATWTTYARVRRQPRIGFALGDGIGCIDLDHCLVDGVLTAPARAFLDRLPATYVEVSPSGTGLHVWGRLPEGRGTRRVVDGLSVETYSTGRYITVTGRRYAGSPSVLADLSSTLAR